MPSVADAIAGAQHPGQRAPKKPTVLVAGAAGRLGERILSRLLGSGDYSRIYVLANDDMRSTESRLTAVTLDHWNERVDHVIAVVEDRDAGGLAHIARKRTDIFSALEAAEVPAIAQRAESLGVARLMVVTPGDPGARPAAIYAQLANVMEADLARLQFEALLLVRPAGLGGAAARPSGFSGLAQRFLHLLLDTARGLMVGKHPPLSLENAARAIVTAMFASAPGIHVIEPEKLHAFLKA